MTCPLLLHKVVTLWDDSLAEMTRPSLSADTIHGCPVRRKTARYNNSHCCHKWDSSCTKHFRCSQCHTAVNWMQCTSVKVQRPEIQHMSPVTTHSFGTDVVRVYKGKRRPPVSPSVISTRYYMTRVLKPRIRSQHSKSGSHSVHTHDYNGSSHTSVGARSAGVPYDLG